MDITAALRGTRFTALLVIGLAGFTEPAVAIYQSLANTPPRVSGVNNPSTDLISGLKVPDGPVVNASPGAVTKYGPPTGYTQLASRANPLVVNGATVGTLNDYVFRDGAGSLIFGLRVLLNQTVNGATNTFEINDFFRKGSTGFSAQAAWSRGSDSDLRMYAAVRSATKFPLAETFHPDVIKFQSDINVSEGNPRSGYFFLKSNAPNFKTVQNALSVYQGGEEGQPLLEIFVPGFVPSSFPDGDGDGYDSGVDCNDANATINPGAAEVCDGIDNNCTAGVDEMALCPVEPQKIPVGGWQASILLAFVISLIALLLRRIQVVLR